MEVKTFRARSMQEALQIVRRTLGPDASLLQAREVGRGPLPWLTGAREIEVLASTGVPVPSRFSEPAELPAAPDDLEPPATVPFVQPDHSWLPVPPAHGLDYRAKFRTDLKGEDADQLSLVEQLASEDSPGDCPPPAAVSRLLADLLEADVGQDQARDLVERVQRQARDHELDDLSLLKSRAARLIEGEIPCCGPIQLGSSPPRVVALIGPTGVGKTTTVAKLAAIHRLQERRRVGLITVDTFRLAAVEQLRTYAEIIDLPIEVVSTPREMRLAVDCLAGLDLILIDTAGRSPRDAVRMRELKSLLVDAQADEVHLVLSSAAGAASLVRNTEQFRQVGVTSLLLTKLDEAGGLGSLLTLLESSRLPLSYVTCGQNVPDDIEPADSRKLACLMLGMKAY